MISSRPYPGSRAYLNIIPAISISVPIKISNHAVEGFNWKFPSLIKIGYGCLTDPPTAKAGTEAFFYDAASFAAISGYNEEAARAVGIRDLTDIAVKPHGEQLNGIVVDPAAAVAVNKIGGVACKGHA